MGAGNILFVMCDQLRWDYLSCAGHQTLDTPNIDALAKRGVMFRNTYCQSPVCGPSRMSFYTGRYPSSNGATSNHTPLRVGERNIGDHLKPLGVRPILVGKTHMVADKEGMERLGIDPDSIIGVHHREAGFDVWERDDGFHSDQIVKPNLAYNRYLREQGYSGKNPWHWAANSVDTPDGVRSGFLNDVSDLPARVRDEESETPWMTRRAMAFLDQDDDPRPWLLHLSYIKPHWPYIAPAPYNAMYGPTDIAPVIRHPSELDDPNPLLKLFMDRTSGKTFSRDEAREKVIPVYMGLIKQIDDQLGQLFAFMENRGLLDDTMIVFTSDHGDYLGDHWMGDKDFFHDPSVKIPMIVVDPSPEADATRGTVSDALVEGVDLIPTFVEHHGGAVESHILEGRSLKPLLRGDADAWRDYAISEYDYSLQNFRPAMERPSIECRCYMVATKRWKYVHSPGFPPVLFDLENDPNELCDLGRDPSHEETRREMHLYLADWALQYRQRETWDEAAIDRITAIEEKIGALIGYWDEEDFADPANIPDSSERSGREDT